MVDVSLVSPDLAARSPGASPLGLLRLLASAAAVLEFGARPFVVGAATVFIATTVAALIPLPGTTRIDPAQALRTE